MEEEKDWTVPDENGIIHVPDELDKLFNTIGFQFRFHTISGLNEIECIARATRNAHEFFKKNPHLIHDNNNDNERVSRIENN